MKTFKDIEVQLSNQLKIKIFAFTASFLTFILPSTKIKWKNVFFLRCGNFLTQEDEIILEI